MSEKRFVLAYENGNEAIFEDLDYPYRKRLTNREVEKLLNEQQSTISKQKKRIERLETILCYCNEAIDDE